MLRTDSKTRPESVIMTQTSIPSTTITDRDEVIDKALSEPVKSAPRSAPSLANPNVSRRAFHPLDRRSIGAVTDPLELSEQFWRAGLVPRLSFGFPVDPHPTQKENLARCERFYLIGVKES